MAQTIASVRHPQLPDEVIRLNHLHPDVLALITGTSPVGGSSLPLYTAVPCADTLTIGSLVYLTPDLSLERVADHRNYVPVQGVVIDKPEPITANMLIQGVCSVAYPGIRPERPVFVGLDGQPSPTPPTTGYVQKIGYGLNGGTFLFMPTMTYRVRRYDVLSLDTRATYLSAFAPSLLKAVGAAVEWDVGDGTVLTGNSISHMYSDAGLPKIVTMTFPESDEATVTELRLNGGELTGVIPPELIGFPSLEVLDLSYNHFYGDIPYEFSTLVSMEHLDVSHNELSGYLPEELAALPALQSIKLSYNVLSREDISDFVTALWNNRVALGARSCLITLENNQGLTPDAVDRINGLGVYAGDGLVQAGCVLSY